MIGPILGPRNLRRSLKFAPSGVVNPETIHRRQPVLSEGLRLAALVTPLIIVWLATTVCHCAVGRKSGMAYRMVEISAIHGIHRLNR